MDDIMLLKKLNEEEKMQLTTGEIKILIRNCMEQCESKTIPEIEEYIKQHSNKQCTKGQLAGAIAQLVDRNEISRIERGIYRKAKGVDGPTTADAQNVANLKNQIKACLRKTTIELARIVSSFDILIADEEDFDLLNKIRTLRGEMESIINQE